MAIKIPQQSAQLPPVQRSRYQVPIEQIIATQGHNPIAQGINTIVPVLAQALQKRAMYRQQAQQVQQIAQLAGQQDPGAASGLSPETYIAGLKAKAELNKANEETWTPMGVDPKTNELIERSKNGSIRRTTNPVGGQMLPLTNNPSTNVPEFDPKVDKAFSNVEKRLDPAETSNRQVFGKNADVIRRVNNAMELYQKNGFLTNAEANSIYTDIAGVLAGSTGSGIGEAMSKMHGYNTLYGDTMKAKQYLTGRPEQAVPDAIAQRLMSNLNGFKDVADKQIKDTQAGILYTNQHLSKIDAARYRQLFDRAGIDPSEIVKGRYVPKAAGGGAETPQQRKTRLIQELKGAK